MLPAKRRDMFCEFRSHVATLATQLGKSAFKIDRVPEDDRGDQKVEARGAIGLALEAPVAHFTQPIEEDRAGECVARLALVEARIAALG